MKTSEDFIQSFAKLLYETCPVQCLGLDRWEEISEAQRSGYINQAKYLGLTYVIFPRKFSFEEIEIENY